jgi:hypothetical protein
MVLIDDLGDLLPHPPALRPPRLLDLAAGGLITLQNQLSTEAVDKLGLTNLENDSQSRFEVDLLFFAQETALLTQGLVWQPIAVLIPVSFYFARLPNHPRRLT